MRPVRVEQQLAGQACRRRRSAVGCTGRGTASSARGLERGDGELGGLLGDLCGVLVEPVGDQIGEGLLRREDRCVGVALGVGQVRPCPWSAV